MSVTITTSAGSVFTMDRAKTFIPAVQHDRKVHRAPFTSSIFSSGDGRRQEEYVEIRFEVYADSIQQASPVIALVRAHAEDASKVETPLGTWMLKGMTQFSEQPSENGYRVSMTFLAASPRSAASAGSADLYAGSTTGYAGSTTGYAGATT